MRGAARAIVVDTTVIIPTYNRPERLRDCLDALMQSTTAPLEVVVVDDGGDVDLAPIVAPFPAVRLVRQANAGPAAARNAGATAARGEYLVFTDDDCLPRVGWSDALVAVCRATPDVLAGGQVENVLTSNAYSAASQALCDFLVWFFERTPSSMAFFTSNSIACRREAFLSIGGFDTTFPLPAAEDRDFGMRWTAAGRPMTFVHTSVLGHSHHLTLSSYVRQHANYGRGARHLHGLMRARGDSPLKVEWARFHVRLLMFPFSAGARRPVQQMLLLVLSQVAMVWGYVSESVRPGRRGGR